jgi:hypothetical protein
VPRVNGTRLAGHSLIPDGFPVWVLLLIAAVLLAVAVIGSRRASPQARAEGRRFHLRLAKYYLAVAGVATVLLAVIGVLAVLDG